jgi:hypothetical protein
MNINRYIDFLVLKNPLVCLIIISSVLSFNLGCQPTPSDHLGTLLKALKDQRWTDLEDRYLSVNQLRSFPLKIALDKGAQWAKVARIHRAGRHLIFDVDLKISSHHLSETPSQKSSVSLLTSSSGQLSSGRSVLSTQHSSRPPKSVLQRHTFWVKAPQPQYQGDSVQALNSQTFSGSTLDGELGDLGPIVGWSEPRSVTSSVMRISDIQAPPRFTARTYRTINDHRDALSNARIKLGVIGVKGSGAIESGWRGTFQVLDTIWRRLNDDRRGCSKPRKRWKRKTLILMNDLQDICHQSLLRAAQRTRYSEVYSHQPHVEIGDEGGREIRDAQTRSMGQYDKDQGGNLKNGVAFSGRISLKQPLNFKTQLRPLPTLSEAMIIAPSLIKCIQREVKRWSLKVSPRSTDCEVELAIHFKVSPDDIKDSSADSL